MKFAEFLRTLFLKKHIWWLTASEVFYNDFVDISYENASCRILEALLWLQFIYILIKIAFWLVKYLFRLMGTL